MKAMVLRFLLGRGLNKAQELLSKAVRHGVGAGGGALVNWGLVSQDETSTAIGGVMAVFSLLWSAGRTLLERYVRDNL